MTRSDDPDFARPDGWAPFAEEGPTESGTGSPVTSAPPPWLATSQPSPGSAPEPAESSWPSVPAHEPSGPQDPARPPVKLAPTWQNVAGKVPRKFLLLAGLLVICLVVAVVSALSGQGSRPSRPAPPPSETQPEPAVAEWVLPPDVVRPDLAGAAFLPSLDGVFESGHLLALGPTWLVATADDKDDHTVVHGIDPDSGRELWERPLRSALCAADPLDGMAVCASALTTDTHGLGTRWQLSLLDLATGTDVRTVVVDAWLTAIAVRESRIVLIEQRLPAPHLVVSTRGIDLAEQASFDLTTQDHHDVMFTDNRILSRRVPLPDGPALDRPRLRTVAGGRTALWIGGGTAFFDFGSGTLLGLLRCSRLVDDGGRLWCNDGDQAVSYSYDLVEQVRTARNTRLIFPGRDPQAGDITDPVFSKANGEAVRIDPRTGKQAGVLAATRNGSAFGLTVPPGAFFVDGITLLRDQQLVTAVNASTGEELWSRTDLDRFDDVHALANGRLLLSGRNLVEVDPATGTDLRARGREYGTDTLTIGDVPVSVGSGEIARLAP